MKSVLHFFDKLEDHVRGYLSHYPIWYAIVGGIGVVLFWRGVWVTTDYAVEVFAGTASVAGAGATMVPPTLVWWDGPLCFALGLVVLLMTGVFVSNFIGNEIIITGLRGDKKISEKTEQDVRMEVGAIGEIRREARAIAERLERLERALGEKRKQ